jgi:hypothetical protein
VFIAGVPPLHALKLALGDAMVRIGAARTAQNVFEELAEHARVLSCMRVAGDESRAEEFCLELLAKTPTPELWSVLGELRGIKRGGVECYERAWQLSNGRYSPAKRALGRIADRRAAMARRDFALLDGARRQSHRRRVVVQSRRRAHAPRAV